LMIQDQGTGMDSEVLEKIGTPFFTTKENGTGLGLAICYSVAKRHQANISIETSEKGTTFSVRFSSTH
jgi:two-component system, sporulation sensor kinase E